MRKKEEVVQLRLRVRPDLLKRLTASAKRRKVPVNSEIVRRLEASLSESHVEEIAESVRLVREEMAQFRDTLRNTPLALAEAAKKEEKK